VQGRWAEANPETARSLNNGDHLIGSHSHYHARMTLFSERGFATDVRWAERAIERIVRTQPRPWFRFPFGTGSDSRRVLQQLTELGYRPIGWHVDSKDWHIRATAERVADAVFDGARAAGDGAIVLFHTWPRSTAEALPMVVARLREAGAEFVTVDSLRADAVPPGPAGAPAPDPDRVSIAPGEVEA
jgi:peptidoglycan/xylan/chitin deacetylase (PgdA/CDA1 family)